MQYSAIRWATLVVAVFLFGVRAKADAALSPCEAFCHDWFGSSAHLRPMALAETNTVVSEVTLGGQTYGWIFRTDQVPPTCKGKLGEIALAVALGTDGRIKGLHVLCHKEDAPYFKRLNASFFQQFQNQRADAGTAKIDAVTRATLSSNAIIRDVMEGAKHVIALPEVSIKIKSAQDCSLTKTAAMFHN